jgi:hypothetical protein
MLSLRNRFGIPGVISVIALVFALVAGTAYAADNSGDGASASAKKNNRAKKNRKGNAGLNGKQKRQVVALAKRFASAGPMGPQGVPGLPGAPGAKGSDGDDGSDGSDGSDGASVVTSDEGAGANCPLGGSKFEVAGQAATYACDGLPGATGAKGDKGDTGDPWTAGGTLPAGATQTGTYFASGDSGSVYSGAFLIAPISFPIPVASSVPAGNVIFVSGGSDPTCTGTVTNPTAPEGHLCIYQQAGGNSVFVGVYEPDDSSPEVPGATPTGALLAFGLTGASGFSYGTWAVTGFDPAP